MTASAASGQITAGRENRHRRPKGYDLDYRPQRKTLALLDQVQGVLEEYEEYLPLTVRQIFYRLVGQHGFEKTEQAYERLAEALVRARRAKLLPFEAIRDDGIVTIETTFYDGIEDFDDHTARRASAYRRNRQADQPQYIELWCEAAGMLLQLQRVAQAFSVPVYSAGGFGSLTGNYGMARRALQRSVPTVILHVGDFDPSGESIFAAMTDDVVAFVEADRTILTQKVRPVRVALTAEQVELYELETSPPKKTDLRSRNWTGNTCQLEALAPDLLGSLVSDAIERELNPGTYQRQLVQERFERAVLLGLPAGEE